MVERECHFQGWESGSQGLLAAVVQVVEPVLVRSSEYHHYAASTEPLLHQPSASLLLPPK